MTAPKPKTAEIAERINRELLKSRSDELVIKRLEREVAALGKSSDSQVRAQALALHGAIAALRFDVDQMRTHFEQALAASGYVPHVYANYAAMLGGLGLSGEALAMAERALAKSPNDPENLRVAIHTASNAFAVDQVERYASELAKLGKLSENDPYIRKALGALKWQRTVLAMPMVTPQSLLLRYDTARGIAREHRVRTPEERATTSSRGTLVEWSVDGADDEIAAMNLEVATRLSALEPDPSELAIAFGFTSQQAVAASVA